MKLERLKELQKVYKKRIKEGEKVIHNSDSLRLSVKLVSRELEDNKDILEMLNIQIDTKEKQKAYYRTYVRPVKQKPMLLSRFWGKNGR